MYNNYISNNNNNLFLILNFKASCFNEEFLVHHVL